MFTLQITTLVESQLKDILPTFTTEDIIEDASVVVDIAWNLFMFSPPAVICMPGKYTKGWHIEHGEQWDSSKPEKAAVYFRPLLLHAAGGTAAIKGLVGNIDEVHSASGFTQSSNGGSR